MTGVDRQAEAAGPGLYQIGLPLLCADERQGPQGIHLPAQEREDGGAVAADKVVLTHRRAETALPPACRASASANRPAGQA